MSMLFTAPWSNDKEISAWFDALPEADKKDVQLKLFILVGDLRNSLFKNDPLITKTLIPGLISLFQHAGLIQYARNVQEIMSQPGIDASPESSNEQ